MLHSSGIHKQEVFASKASPSSVLINWDRLSLVLRSSVKLRRRRTKTLVMRILALKTAILIIRISGPVGATRSPI